MFGKSIQIVRKKMLMQNRNNWSSMKIDVKKSLGNAYKLSVYEMLMKSWINKCSMIIEVIK